VRQKFLEGPFQAVTLSAAKGLAVANAHGQGHGEMLRFAQHDNQEAFPEISGAPLRMALIFFHEPFDLRGIAQYS
jgi:hypothetical protein